MATYRGMLVLTSRRDGGYRSARRMGERELKEALLLEGKTGGDKAGACRSEAKTQPIEPGLGKQLRGPITLSPGKIHILELMHERGGTLVQEKRRGQWNGRVIDGQEALGITCCTSEIKSLCEDGLATSHEEGGVRRTTLTGAGSALAEVIDVITVRWNQSLQLGGACLSALAYLHYFGSKRQQPSLDRWGAVSNLDVLHLDDHGLSMAAGGDRRLTVAGKELCEKFLIPYHGDFGREMRRVRRWHESRRVAEAGGGAK